MSPDPRHELAAQLRRLASLLLSVDEKGTPTWHPEGRFQSDGLLVVRAGVAMLSHGEDAERLARTWAATGLVSTASEPGIREGCNCPDDGNCPHGSVTERGALNRPDEWHGRLARLRQQRGLLADNAHDYDKLVDLITRVGERLGRVSSTDMCAGCRQPILERTKTLDGVPYHRGSCWWAAYNETRGRRGA